MYNIIIMKAYIVHIIYTIHILTPTDVGNLKKAKGCKK